MVTIILERLRLAFLANGDHVTIISLHLPFTVCHLSVKVSSFVLAINM